MSNTIKCPACGEVVEADLENCPSCGAPIGVLAGNDISGAPIDNKAAIDAMLRSASMLMNESEALGIGSLDDPSEDDEEDEETEEEVLTKTPKNELPSELSKEQKKSMEAGGVINLSPDSVPAPVQPAASAPPTPAAPPAPAAAAAPANAAPAAPLEDEVMQNFRELQSQSENAAPPAKPPKPPKKGKEPVIYELDENGNAIDNKPKKEKKEKKKKEKREHPPKDKKQRSPAKTLLTVVITLAIGLCAGYFGKIFLFPDFPAPKCQEFAAKSVDAVVQVTSANKQLYIAEAYVKEGTYAVQCIFRALVENQGEVESKWYRVKVDNDDKSTINVYFELNPDEYDRLRNSDDSENRANAAVLKSNQNELERCINEVREGITGWEAANVTLINNTLHPYTPPVSETETETEAEE